LLHRPPRARAERLFEQQHFWVNHYPVRRARFDGFRQDLFRGPASVRYVYVRTSYRGHQQTVGIEVRPVDGKLRLRPLAPLPAPPPRRASQEAAP
jgi:hypothetical protein